VKVEVLKVHSGIERFAGLVLNLAEEVGVSAGAVEQEHGDDEAEDDGEDDDRADEFCDGEKAMARGVRRLLLVAVG